MIHTLFTSFIGIFERLLVWMTNIWYAVGNFGPIFLGIFAFVVTFRFIIYPFLGGRSFGLPFARSIEPREKSEHYQDTKIGFTSGW